MIKLCHISFTFLTVLFLSCSRTDCRWETETEPFSFANLKSNSLSGVYKLSEGSTDNSFSTDSLSKSVLYILIDSSARNGDFGQLLFKDFPYWSNADHKNLLGVFWGRWEVKIDKGNLFAKNLFVFAPMFVRGENEPPISTVMRHDLRLKNGRPLLIITVLKNFRNDSQFGQSLVYNSTKSSDACNYLIFERISEISPNTQTNVTHELDSLKALLNR